MVIIMVWHTTLPQMCWEILSFKMPEIKNQKIKSGSEKYLLPMKNNLKAWKSHNNRSITCWVWLHWDSQKPRLWTIHKSYIVCLLFSPNYDTLPPTSNSMAGVLELVTESNMSISELQWHFNMKYEHYYRNHFGF